MASRSSEASEAIDPAGLLVTLAASNNSDVRAAFIAGVVAPDSLKVLTIFATIFVRKDDRQGHLAVLTVQASGTIAEAKQRLPIGRSSRPCPPGQVCQESINPGPGGCNGCCGGWTQIYYVRCSGTTQYNCVSLQRQCCCCDNAATCWNEYTGENCTFYCTAGCNPGDCTSNACGGCI